MFQMTLRGKERLVPLGTLFDVFYLDVINDAHFQDVCFKSVSGKTFKVNRSVLASASQLCCDLMPEIDTEECVHISTNIEDSELACLMDFLKSGSLPAAKTNAFQLDVTKANVFAALGIDLMFVSTGIKSRLEPEVKQGVIKSEAAEEDFDDIYITNEDVGKKEEEEYESQPLKRKRKPRIQSDVKRRCQVSKGINRVGSKPDELFHFPQTGERALDTLKYQCQHCVRGFKELEDYRQHL